MDEITTADVLTVLEPIWTKKPETASRVRQRMETVFDWALARSYRSEANPAGKHLPNVKKLKAHYKALPYQDVPAALRKIRLSSARTLTRLAYIDYRQNRLRDVAWGLCQSVLGGRQYY